MTTMTIPTITMFVTCYDLLFVTNVQSRRDSETALLRSRTDSNVNGTGLLAVVVAAAVCLFVGWLVSWLLLLLMMMMLLLMMMMLLIWVLIVDIDC